MVNVFAYAVAYLAVFLAGAFDAKAMPPVRTSSTQHVPECVTPDRLMAFLQSRNPWHDQRYDDIAEIYAAEGRRLGIRWDFAFFHMLHETGDLSFRRSPTEPGPVAPEQNNFAGLGAAGEGVPGESFADVYSGVRAHLEHLLVYSGIEVPNPVSRRTYDVQKWGVLKSWLQELDGPVTFADLSRRWAMGQEAYVRALARIASAFFAKYCDGADMLVATLVRPPQLAKAWVAVRPSAASAERAATSPSVARTSLPNGNETRVWQEQSEPRATPPRPSVPPRSRTAETGDPQRGLARRPDAPKPKAVAALPRVKPARIAPDRSPPPVREPEPDPLHKLVSGNTVHITTSMGVTLPVKFEKNGEIIGRANGYGFYLGAEQDRGKWWIEKSMVCTRWRIWLDRETSCIRVVQKRGKRFYWRSADGAKSGTARIVDG